MPAPLFCLLSLSGTLLIALTFFFPSFADLEHAGFMPVLGNICVSGDLVVSLCLADGCLPCLSLLVCFIGNSHFSKVCFSARLTSSPVFGLSGAAFLWTIY